MAFTSSRIKCQLPFTLDFRRPSYRVHLLDLIGQSAYAAGAGSRSGHFVTVTVIDYNWGADPEEDRSVIPEMPLLRIQYGSSLLVQSIRSAIGGHGRDPDSIRSSDGFRGEGNVGHLEFFLDTDTLSTRPSLAAKFADEPPTEGPGVLANPDWYASYNSGGTVFFTPSYIFTAKGTWMDNMFLAAARGGFSKVATRTGESNSFLRLCFAQPLLMQRGTGVGDRTATIQTDLSLNRFQVGSLVNSDRFDPRVSFVDLAFVDDDSNPVCYNAVGSLPGRNFYALNAWHVHYAQYSWTTALLGDGCLQSLLDVLPAAIQVDGTSSRRETMDVYWRWSPILLQSRHHVQLLVDVEITT